MAFIAYFFIVPLIVSFVFNVQNEKQVTIPFRYGFIYLLPILIYSLVVSCAEEIFYRGIMFNHLYHNTGKIRSYVIPGLLFAIFHFKDPITTIAAFLFAIISSLRVCDIKRGF